MAPIGHGASRKDSQASGRLHRRWAGRSAVYRRGRHHLHFYMHRLHVSAHVCTHVCVHAFVRVYAHAHTHVCARAYTRWSIIVCQKKSVWTSAYTFVSPMAHGPQPTPYGPRHMAHGLWPTAYGPRHMALWPMVHGIWPMTIITSP